MRFFFFITIFLFHQLLFSQSDKELIKVLLSKKPEFIEQYQIFATDSDKVFLEMPYDKDSFVVEKDVLSLIQFLPILKIELIYSEYKLSESFNQQQLNKKRLDALNAACPWIFEDPKIKWEVKAQTIAKNPIEARKLFHGFVLTMKHIPTTAEEILGIKSLLESDSLGKDTCYVKDGFTTLAKRKKTGRYLPLNKEKLAEGMVYDSPAKNRKPEFELVVDTTWTKDTICTYQVASTANSYLQKLADNTVLKIFDRNKKWKNMLIVTDVTGSMAPYSLQVLVWSRLSYNSNRAKYFTFFNDGDNQKDELKRIGNTGGIYHISTDKINEIDDLAFYAMGKGTGGDEPENNIEALYNAITKFPEANEIIMIADNNAPVKDIGLLSKIKKPIHVIVCGLEGNIHVDYLEIARKTKGSIHTLEDDLDDLFLLNEGEKVTIEGIEYRIVNGKMKQITGF